VQLKSKGDTLKGGILGKKVRSFARPVVWGKRPHRHEKNQIQLVAAEGKLGHNKSLHKKKQEKEKKGVARQKAKGQRDKGSEGRGCERRSDQRGGMKAAHKKKIGQRCKGESCAARLSGGEGVNLLKGGLRNKE